MAEIDPKKNMAQLLSEFPQLGEVLKEMNIDCAACLASQVDTMLDVVRMYHLDLEELLLKIHERE